MYVPYDFQEGLLWQFEHCKEDTVMKMLHTVLERVILIGQWPLASLFIPEAGKV